jgi:hypothetical protein
VVDVTVARQGYSVAAFCSGLSGVKNLHTMPRKGTRLAKSRGEIGDGHPDIGCNKA